MNVVELHGQRVIVDAVDADAAVAAELGHWGADSVMVIGSERALSALAWQTYPATTLTVWSDVYQHVPRSLVDRALEMASEVTPDTIIAIGGGSALGLAKAIALSHPVRIIAIPTTLAGSEVTSIYGITENGNKVTGRHASVRPTTIIYHGALLAQMPPQALADSAANALAHCVDARFVAGAHPLINQVATLGHTLLHDSVGEIISGQPDSHHYSQAQLAGYWAGMSLELAGSGPHHKICHVLGGMLDTPHSGTHAAVLRHIMGLFGRDFPDTLESIHPHPTPQQGESGVVELLSTWQATTALPGFATEDDVSHLVSAIRSHLTGSLGERWSDDDLTALVSAVCDVEFEKGR